MVLNSYAKLNLYLSVLNRRKDNYHNIETVFERISLCDKVILSSRRDKEIKIACSDPSVPEDNSNLAYRSAKLLQDKFGIQRGLNIRIIKRIPVGAGLGGGSGNAATVLTGLNKFWKLNLSSAKLVKLAGNLGSDVPFFVYDTPFARGEGRGDRIKPIRSLSRTRLWHILVVPKLEVSTPLIYKNYDKHAQSGKKREKIGLTAPFLAKNSQNKLERAGLTMPEYDVKILTSALRKKDFFSIGRAMFNSLDAVTSELYPQVTQVKEKLVRLGLKAILMSGSGPAVFGVVSSRKEAVSFRMQLKAEVSRWRVFVSETV